MCWGQIIGMGAQAGQGIMQGQQNAETLEANARVYDMKANDAIVRGAAASNEQRDKTRMMVGQQRAALGASGVDVNTGTAAAVQTQTAGIGELDAQTIQNNSLREAWGYQNEAAFARAAAVQAGQMQRMLMPGLEGGKVKDVLGQQLLGGNPLQLGKQMDYIKTGKYNSGGIGSSTSTYVGGGTGSYYRKAGL